ncbi:MAG TPA: serine/threonine-protein kinase, partial [Tepidisphaeraceae bacterium]|nr:serine/threonine-protein kinase [Tepidisphaeraceae bacterium]
MSTRQKHFAFNLLDLVDQLRDLGGAERRRRIENLSLTDTQRAQLEKCLSALPRAEGFLEDPPTLVRNAWSQTRPTPRPMLGSVNEPFGEYRLIEHLASGTFGEVWVAAHRSLDTPGTVPTCLKLLYPDRSDLEDVLREARTMASIRHENVVSVRRADRADVGGQEIAFIEMELVGEAGEGGRFEPAKSLAAGVEDGTPRFTCKETVRIVADVCRGVHAAHVRGTLHRDLKPANILLEMKSRRAKVTDFGIASHFVAEGVVVGPSKGLGTPAYMAPEQARGQATQASDIYAMGAVLYFLLAGHAPYGGTAGNSSSADWQKILDQLRRGEPPAPLPVGKRRLPGPVVAIVRRAMAVDSAARYASAAAMADDLDAFCAGRPTAAARPGAAGRLRLWTRRNPTVALLLLAMLVGAVVGPAVYIRDTRREQRRTESQRAIAVENEKLAIAQRQRAERQVAEGLVLQADALSLAARWLEARSLYREGAAALASMGLATFSADTGAWAVERGTCLPLTEWRSPEWPALATAFSPDCLLFASGGGDKILRLWDPMTGRLVHELPGTGGSIDAIAFSPDGSTVAFGGADGALRLWRINSTEPARVIGTSKKRIRSVAFSPDGRVVACGGDDHFLRTWDLPTGESRLTLAFKRPVTSICFFPDGQRLAITAENLSVVELRSSTVTHSMPTLGSLAALSRDG